MSSGPAQTLTFRCPRELEGLLPPPVPAARGLPDWIRDMPQEAYSALVGGPDDTVKRCPPFIDGHDRRFPHSPDRRYVTVENGQFTWDLDLPSRGEIDYARSPIGFHEASQVTGSPLFNAERNLIKFHNLWTIEAPEGYAVLFTHPVNRFDLPFTTLAGLVDCDRYRDGWINFPAVWRETHFRGVLPKGTPIAQCFPIRREAWNAGIATFSDADAAKARDLMRDTRQEKGVYRRRFRA